MLYTTYLQAVYNASLIECMNKTTSGQKEMLQRHADFSSKFNVYSDYPALHLYNFCLNTLIVSEFNKDKASKKRTFEVGVNSLGDLTYGQYLINHFNIALRDSDKMEFRLANFTLERYDLSDQTTVPDSIDYRDYLRAPLNQDRCQSSYLHAGTDAIAFAYAKNNNLKNISISKQYFIDCGHQHMYPSCSGGNPEHVFDFSSKFGIVKEEAYPYKGVARRCNVTNMEDILPFDFIKGAFHYNMKKTDEIKKLISKYGPLVTSMSASDVSIMLYSNGIINQDCEDKIINHYVLIVGYGKDEESGVHYWIVRNSFGEDWGEGGYFRIEMGRNLCNIEKKIIGLIAKDLK